MHISKYTPSRKKFSLRPFRSKMAGMIVSLSSFTSAVCGRCATTRGVEQPRKSMKCNAYYFMPLIFTHSFSFFLMTLSMYMGGGDGVATHHSSTILSSPVPIASHLSHKSYLDQSGSIFSASPFGSAPSLSSGNSWSNVVLDNPNPDARMFHTTTSFFPESCGKPSLIFGGIVTAENNRPFEFSNETWIYLFDTNTYHLLPESSSSPPARAGHTAILVGKKIVMFGGFNSTEVMDDLWIFNGSACRLNEGATMWMKIPCPINNSCPAARWGHSAAANETHMFILGGSSTVWTACNASLKVDILSFDLYAFDVGKQQWSIIRALSTPPARMGFAMTTTLSIGNYTDPAIIIFSG